MADNLIPSPRFTKNDSGFICASCKAVVPPLISSSRDHCNNCLHSLHVDINPGDRANECKGVLCPVGIRVNNKKGYVIEYRCSSCNAAVLNKAAPDDNFDEILKISQIKSFKA